MTTIRWTDQAIADLAAIRAFIEQDSPHYSSVVVSRLIRAVERLKDFPTSGRIVPEFEQQAVREVVERPYRIVYRLAGEGEIRILTVHHGARRMPDAL